LFSNKLSLFYEVVVSIVQLLGTPLAPRVVQVAALFLTNVPVEATPETQSLVYEVPGVVVNNALI
jgi:hypothetical protein